MVRRAEYPLADNDIAIVGMAGRFPGARTADGLWRLVDGGLTGLVTLTDEQLLAAGVPPDLLHDPDYVRVAGTIEDVDCFDAAFFDIGPRDAAIMDPQHRHFLECAWEALENSGHMAASFKGAIGVYAGCGQNGYLLHNLLSNPELVNSLGIFLLRHTANDNDFLATHVSYKLDLKGPSITVQTACSTSLVALHLAAQGLLNGECDLALAGGVTVQIPSGAGYIYKEGEILSPDGACRAFDASANGTILTSGLGIVVLRRLREALDEGDFVHAVIRASAVNNDGSAKVGYLAPSVDGHASVAAEALALAEVDPASVQYVEAHGTGTNVGDPIEIAALSKAYGATAARKNSIRLGSTKPNIGHLDTAAGIASVIKTVEAMKHGTLPPLANFQTANPLADIQNGPFYISAEPSDWPDDRGPRRAGVSSLGVGGTNAHIILQEGPEPTSGGISREWQLLLISAKTSTALDIATERLAAFLQENPNVNLADVAHTLQTGRARFSWRRVVVCRSVQDAIDALQTLNPRRVITGQVSAVKPAVAFMFPGGGSQYPNMGRDLWETERVYREEIERCLAALDDGVSELVQSSMFPPRGDDEIAAETLQRPSIQLPAIFITEYALAKLWLSWGVEPAAMTGHSLGEYAAACLAGVMSLGEALEIVHLRGQIMERVPDAAMLSVSLGETELGELLNPALSIAALNAPSQSVVSGSGALVDDLERDLITRDVEFRRLKINGAVHCGLLDPYLGEFREQLSSIRLKPPSVPYVSNVTGTWVRTEDAIDPDYWTRHLRGTVRFGDGVQTLVRNQDCVLVEVGPGTTLGTLLRHQPGHDKVVVASLPHPQDRMDGIQCILTSLGRAWISGLEADWNKLHGSRRLRVPLPTYPFERTRHWIEPGAGATERRAHIAKSANLDEWFYRPIWKRADLLPAETGVPLRWLIFDSGDELGRGIIGRLRELGHRVTVATIGQGFSLEDVDSYVVNPNDGEDFARLIGHLASDAGLPDRIVHLWSLAANGELSNSQRLGFESLIHLGRALANEESSAPLHLSVVTDGMQQVDGEAVPHPEASTVLGPVRVLPNELPGLSAQSIDISLPPRRSIWFGKRESAGVLTGAVVGELLRCAADEVVAYRAGKRWVQCYDSAPLSAMNQGATQLRYGGVYVITGGLGGIGLALAEHLAKNWHAKLVLLSRTALPDRGDWENWLASHEESNSSSRRIRAIRKLEEQGSEVLHLAAHVCDRQMMRQAFEDALGRFGVVNGVFHAAGVIDDQLVQFKSIESARAVLAPKVLGTLVLHEVFSAAGIDFIILFSSISAILGLDGQADYAAANAFLNAFASAKSTPSSPRIIAVDWGMWRNVGMTARPKGGQGAGAAPLAAHALLGSNLLHTETDAVFEAEFDTKNQFVLGEHRLQSGEALLPGAGFVEMADAAAKHLGGRGIREITRLAFLAPLHVPDGHAVDVRTSLRANGNVWNLTVSSRPRNAGGTQVWREHATAEIRYCSSAPSPSLDIEQIEQRCVELSAEYGPHEPATLQRKYLNLGPRWANLRSVRYGKHQALGRLELPERFRGDLSTYGLHPALLDIATSFGLPMSGDFDKGDGFFVPFSIEKIRVHGPLPERLVSVVRQREPSKEQDLVAFDVAIVDENGGMLVELEEFAFRRISSTARLISASALAPGYMPVEISLREPTLAPVEGIEAEEGMAALERILQNPFLPQIVVSPSKFDALRQMVRASANDGAHQVKVARPGMESAYVAPGDAIEKSLAEMWEDLLGVESVGVHDDFFELGGHSLIAARLLTRVKKVYGIQLPLACLFEMSTIAELAAYLRDDARALPGFIEESRVNTAGVAVSSLVPLQPEGAKPPMFLVHGKNGNVMNFRDLALRLGKDQPSFGLQAAGLDGSVSPHVSIEEMASHYISEVKRVQPEGPYLLGGFSGGGVIAYEMALQLKAREEEVALLAFIDTMCPDWFIKKSLWDRCRWFLKGLAVERQRFVSYTLHRWLAGPPPGSTPLQIISDDEIEAFDLSRYFEEAEQRYRLRHWDGPVTLFRATLRAERGYVPRDIGWGPFVDVVRVVDVPGGHESMCMEPNVGVLAERLKCAIAEAGIGAEADLAAVGA
jgi:acyl transferase domain-containing protein